MHPIDTLFVNLRGLMQRDRLDDDARDSVAEPIAGQALQGHPHRGTEFLASCHERSDAIEGRSIRSIAQLAPDEPRSRPLDHRGLVRCGTPHGKARC